MMSAVWARIWGYLAAVGGVVAALAGVWLSGRRAGRTAAEAEVMRRGEEARVRAEAAEREAQREDLLDRLRRGGF